MDFYTRICLAAQSAPLAYMTAGVVAGAIVLAGPGVPVIQGEQAHPHNPSYVISASISNMGTSIHAPLNFGPQTAAGTASAFRF